MNNYTIDASVYALPQTSGESDADDKVIFNYLKGINTICDLAERRDINIFLLYRDVKLLDRLKLLPDIDSMKSLKMQKIIYNPGTINRFLDYLLRSIQDYASGKTADLKDAAKYKVFENKFCFNIKLDENSGNSIAPVEIKNTIGNEELRDNFVKNSAIIAKLNEHVYKNNPDRHKIILNTPPCEIEIKNVTIKEILMEPVKDKNGVIRRPIIYYNIFPPPLINIKISNTLIGAMNISTVRQKEKIEPGSSDIYSVYKTAKQEFGDTLIFGKDVKRGIDEYWNKIKEELEKNPGWDVLKEKTKNLPWILRSYLEVLHDVSLDPGFYQCSSSSNYCCSPCCSLIHKCKSLISLMGLNCSDEDLRQMNDDLVEKARQFDDGSGNKELFTLHLKPLSEERSTDLWFLTLRIYFKVKGGKIVIGWIGQHRYLP
jgi:hypothetical protein